MPAVARATAPVFGATKMTSNVKNNSTENTNKLNGVSRNSNNINRDDSKKEQCSNPFRIPRHDSRIDLRLVPQLIRERLTHVHFGRKICFGCRKRVYQMLKERKQIKPLTRRGSNNNAIKRRSEPAISTSANTTPSSSRTQTQQRKSVIGNVSTAVKPLPPPPPAAPSPSQVQPTQVLSTIVTSAVTPTESSIAIASQDVTVSTLPGISRRRSVTSNLADNSSTLPERTMSRRSRPQAQQLQPQVQPNSTPTRQICCFCNLSDDNEVEFGKFYEHSGIVTHYYCLLLSSNMEQKGNDDEGILGFLADDIQKEIRRGKRLVCSYCKKNGATLGCCNAKCKKIFHFPCGLKNGSLHQFFGEFRSYCINHRPKQKIDERVKKEIQNMTNILCYICYEDVEPLDSNKTLWAPCCKKNAWFHRKCVQQLAMSAGYFFKCPLCNNKREFQTAMLEYGICIPRQDASWELVPNAFEELLYRHDRCDAKTCHCPKGRMYTTSNAKWELALCRMCGSQGTHLFCGQLKFSNPVWDCEECISILKKSNENVTDDSTSNSHSNIITRQRENGTLKITLRESDEDSDSDISVGNESLPLENSNDNSAPPIKLRPGPLSFKLQQQQKLQTQNIETDKPSTNLENKNPTVSNVNNKISTASTKPSSDVICIDSDDEGIQIVCESIMKTVIGNNRNLNTINEINNGSNSTPYLKTLLLSPNSKSSGKIMEIDLSASDAMVEIPPTLAEENNDSPFNIIISNVVSVPPEFFASVPETPEESPMDLEPVLGLTNSLASNSSENNLKRKHPDEEGNDCDIIVEAFKRPRLENIDLGLNEEISTGNVDNGVKIANAEPIDSVPLPTIKQSPSKVASTLIPIPGSSGVPSSHENCHGNAGTSPAMVDTERQSSYDSTSIDGTASTTAITAANDRVGSNAPDSSTKCNSKCGIRTVLENGSSSHCSSGGGSSESSKSRHSSCDRSGLIPDVVRIRDLKFKTYGGNLELSYGVCKILVKMEGILSSLNDASNVSALLSPFAGSNQNLSNEKSSKSFQLRSDDSDESEKLTRSSRIRSLRSFVYEDDNTLLEYPTSTSDSQNNAKIMKNSQDKNIAKLDSNDLKENWDPEVSSSSNNTYGNSNNNQINSLNLKDNTGNIHEKIHKNDDGGNIAQSQKEDLGNNQRSLRRSNRIIRHFRSVQQSNVLQNGQINGDSTDSNTNNSFSSPLIKSNQVINDQPVRNSKKILNNSDAVNQNKHLNNVDFNDLKDVLMGKTNETQNNDEVDAEADFKVSIDLKKIKTLISAKPDLFFNTINNGVKRLDVYRMQVDCKSGEKRFLVKSQSFDCLLNITQDNVLNQQGRSKSLNNLSYIDCNHLMSLTDKKDCMERKIRRSQRRKTKQFEKHECVR